MAPIRTAFLLPGLGRVQRGAETAFLEIAYALSKYDDMDVELFGSGQNVPAGLTIHSVPCTSRERFEKWPSLPFFRNEYAWEEASWVRNLRKSGLYDASRFDVTVSCTFPHVNMFLNRRSRNNKPLNLFVTQNGDWMCHSGSREYKLFECDGLITINPEYFDRNKELWSTLLAPNGVDPDVYTPGPAELPPELQINHNGPIVMMASALIPSKRVAAAVEAVAKVPNAFLVVAGDGREREAVAELAERELPGRHRLLGSVPREYMVELFRQADLFLHMSQDEPFGIVYLEAGSCGLPIVCHDSDVSRWIMGNCAEFVDTSDLDAVAAGISRALERERNRQLSASIRERVIAEWSWAAQAAKYRDFIHQRLQATQAANAHKELVTA